VRRSELEGAAKRAEPSVLAVVVDARGRRETDTAQQAKPARAGLSGLRRQDSRVGRRISRKDAGDGGGVGSNQRPIVVTRELEEHRGCGLAISDARAASPALALRPDGPGEAPAELLGSRELAGDVVADVREAARAALEREESVERRDAISLRRRNAQSAAGVVESAAADPADAALHFFQRGKEEVTPRAHGVEPAADDVLVEVFSR
jgi:hypothetical protein